MGGNGDLNLLRSDAVTRTLDNVVLARHEPEVAVLIDIYEVTGQIPTLGGDGTLLFLGIAPIDRARGSASHKVADLADGGLLPLFVYNLQLVARYGFAEGGGFYLTTDHLAGGKAHHLRRAPPPPQLPP